ncbi:response regulator [uncultured Tolumonas sp.]|uniref:response regulator n=1 Tax=uncultured Tolumonas sp. TaxID=263765 RepID=UPI002930EAE8|nr:response regulator [uncultured Tolumonas sp.]
MTLYETKGTTGQNCLEHILVVDDIQTNLRLAKAFLNGGGYQNVYLESDPFRVSEWLNSVDINLLILDLSMPQKDGISLFVELQNEFAERLPPVIFLTALHDDSLRAQAIELGAKAFITKPFDQTKMLSCISEILNSIT